MNCGIITPDENTPRSAMRSADEVLGYCAAMATVISSDSDHPAFDILKKIKEAQRRLRHQTNPEMFNPDGTYR